LSILDKEDEIVLFNKLNAGRYSNKRLIRGGVFVTGTSTGVGKTIVAAGIAWAARKRKIDVGVMKPFASAEKVFSSKYRSEDTALLAKASGTIDNDTEMNPFFYSIPASPMMAAEIEGGNVDIEKAAKACSLLSTRHQFLVVEGIGGIMVPLTENKYVADFARLVDLPIVVVALASLGTLNHTLLTLKACRDYNLEVKGVIVNMMPDKPNLVEAMVPRAIEKTSGIPVLGIVPLSKNKNVSSLLRLVEKNIDIDRILAV